MSYVTEIDLRDVWHVAPFYWNHMFTSILTNLAETTVIKWRFRAPIHYLTFIFEKVRPNGTSSPKLASVTSFLQFLPLHWIGVNTFSCTPLIDIWTSFTLFTVKEFNYFWNFVQKQIVPGNFPFVLNIENEFLNLRTILWNPLNVKKLWCILKY